MIINITCKFSKEKESCKSGKSKGIQRYKCKVSNRHFIFGDKREKCSITPKMQAILLYSTGGTSIPFMVKLLKIPSIWASNIEKNTRLHEQILK